MQNSLVRWRGLGLVVVACFVPLALLPTQDTETTRDSTLRAYRSGDSPPNGASRDHFGDPLPDGAVARLGTVRWRYPQRVELVQFIGTGKQLLSCCGDGLFHVTETASGKPIRHFGNKDGCLETATADGTSVAQATLDGKVHLWNVLTGRQTASFDLGFKRHLRGLRFVRDKQLLAWGDDCTIRVWDIRTDKLVRVLLEDVSKPSRFLDKRDSIYQVGVSPDGTTVAFSIVRWQKQNEGKDGQRLFLSSWSLQDGQRTGEAEVVDGGGWYEGHYANPVFSPDSRMIAWPARDGTIQLYQSANLEQVRTLGDASRNGRVAGACFSGDGSMLAAVTLRRTIQLLDVASGRQLSELGQAAPKDSSSFFDPSTRRVRAGVSGTAGKWTRTWCQVPVPYR